MEIGEPSAFFRDPNRHNFKPSFVDCIEYRGRRQQRNFMLAAPSTEKNSDTKFLQDRSPLTLSPLNSIKQKSPAALCARKQKAPDESGAATV
jgi:hypothetical protein